MSGDAQNDGHAPHDPLLDLGSAQNTSGVSPLEQEVLDEYTRLLNNMNSVSPRLVDRTRHSRPFAHLAQLSDILGTLAEGQITIEIAESLRLLERKVASVYTLMKASVYSIVLQQGQLEQESVEDAHGING